MKQKNYIKPLLLWNSLVVLLVVTCMAITLQSLLTITPPRKVAITGQYNYHVVMITDDRNRSFWEDVYQNACKIADENAIVLEWRIASRAKGESVLELIDIARTIGVDGILTCVPADAQINDLINLAVLDGIPVLTLVDDAPNSLRQGCVGVDNYALGITIGNVIAELEPVCEKALMFTQRDKPDQWVSARSLLAGLNAVMGTNSQQLVETVAAGDSLTIESIVRDTVRGDHKIDTIICHSIEDTITCANAVIENNLVGQIRIIAYNASDEVLEYIQRGVVHAAITSKGELIGRKAMENYLSYINNHYIDTFTSNRIEVIRKENVQDYLHKSEVVL